MKKKYIPPYIETVKLRQNHIMNIAGSNVPTNVKSLDTEVVSGEPQNDNNTLTESDIFL